jgi:hypothetical protein
MINLGGLDKRPELGEGCVEADESWRAREALRQFRRAGIALLAVGAFWLWLLLGSAEFIAAIFQSPKAIVVAFYGGAVLVLVSLLVALTAIMVLLANWPDKSQRAAAYSTTQERTSEAVAFVLRQVRSKTGMLRSGGPPLPGGLSLHAIRGHLSGRLPGLHIRLLAAAGRLAGWAARSAAGLMQQATGTGRSFAGRKIARKILGLQRKDAPVAGVGPLPRAEAARQSPVARPAGPASPRMSLPVRRPPMPSRPPASAAVPQPPQDRRDIAS